ncbi:LysR family transcriptional regulator [Pigmentiphaga aceris]|uniref:LysR family transcriptional regulator n=1 Tax=Pigmentiphaga aceris TaxID=1940612 RepID=A0A5C0AQR0_9BURK|nr:LysR family transcriptional regulator [Pigmentiphaga aceris]QEI04429.1 LysR family transcriptional regulator [Pigmentiphaga aceris]
MINQRQVDVFRALMTTLSVTRAADLLRSSQPTVSRELALLEDELGFALFDRVRGRLRATMAALTMFDEVQRSYVGLERIAATAAMLGAAQGGSLFILSLPVFTQTLLPGACRRFMAMHPAASISIASQESPFLESWLTAQRYDLGLTEGGEAPAGTRQTSLLRADEVCVLPPGHRLARKRRITLADFADECFVSLPADDQVRRQLDAAFDEAGVTRRTQLEAPTSAAVCSLVAQGVGVSIVNPLTALTFVGRVVVRRLSIAIPFDVALVQPEHRPSNPLAASFTRALADEAKALRAQLRMAPEATDAVGGPINR